MSVTHEWVERDENTTKRARVSQPNEVLRTLNPLMLPVRIGEFRLGKPCIHRLFRSLDGLVEREVR